jgi:hypothetical protein
LLDFDQVSFDGDVAVANLARASKRLAFAIDLRFGQIKDLAVRFKRRPRRLLG